MMCTLYGKTREPHECSEHAGHSKAAVDGSEPL